MWMSSICSHALGKTTDRLANGLGGTSGGPKPLEAAISGKASREAHGSPIYDRAEVCPRWLLSLLSPNHVARIIPLRARAIGCRAGAWPAVIQAMHAFATDQAMQGVGCRAIVAFLRANLRDDDRRDEVSRRFPPQTERVAMISNMESAHT